MKNEELKLPEGEENGGFEERRDGAGCHGNGRESYKGGLRLEGWA